MYTPYTPTWNNPYLSQGYQSPYTQQQQPVQQVQQYNGIVKVNGRDSAMQYQLPPNSTSPALFDNNGQVFYVVSTDGTGSKSIETFDFSPHKDEPVMVDGAEFVSRREFDDFAAKVNAVIGAMGNGTDATIPAAADSGTEGGGHVRGAQADGRRKS